MISWLQIKDKKGVWMGYYTTLLRGCFPPFVMFKMDITLPFISLGLKT